MCPSRLHRREVRIKKRDGYLRFLPWISWPNLLLSLRLHLGSLCQTFHFRVLLVFASFLVLFLVFPRRMTFKYTFCFLVMKVLFWSARFLYHLFQRFFKDGHLTTDPNFFLILNLNRPSVFRSVQVYSLVLDFVLIFFYFNIHPTCEAYRFVPLDNAMAWNPQPSLTLPYEVNTTFKNENIVWEKPCQPRTEKFTFFFWKRQPKGEKWKTLLNLNLYNYR